MKVAKNILNTKLLFSWRFYFYVKGVFKAAGHPGEGFQVIRGMLTAAGQFIITAAWCCIAF